MHDEFDAVIIGAGPAGSSAAILLASAGWSVALVEKRSFPRRKVCGECIAASNMPLLHALGIGTEFDRIAGADLRYVAFMNGSSTVTAPLPPASRKEFEWGRALGRETLDLLLLERARSAGVTVFQPWTLHSLDGLTGAWRCQISASESSARQLHARVLIDAHGSWETLPSERANNKRSQRPSDLLAFKANFTGTSLESGLLPVLAFAGGYGGMVVADGNATTLACCIRRDRLRTLRRDDHHLSAGEVVEAMLRQECAGVRKALKSAERSGTWLAAGPLNPGIHVHTDDGIFRIGNAAGEAHPIIGEGMSMALQSAWLLCFELLAISVVMRDGTSTGGVTTEQARQRAVHRRYAIKWHLRFGPRLWLARAFAHASMHKQSANALLKLFGAFPGALPLGAKWSGKMRCAVGSSEIDALRPSVATK